MYLKGGLWVMDDFMVDPVPLALTFAKLAIAKGKKRDSYSYNFTDYLFVGVKIIEDCYVEEILTEKQRIGQSNRVTSAVTSHGNIKCDVFINCTGIVSSFSSNIFRGRNLPPPQVEPVA